MGFAAESFSGREAELDVLAQFWKVVRAGQRRVVVVDGPAGIGKSSLVRAFLRAHDVVPVAASGDEAEVDVPYGVVEQLALALPSEDLTRELRRSRTADPVAVGASLLEALTDAGDAGPSVVVIEDAHWADPGSMAALAFAWRRLRDTSVLLIVVCRDRERVAASVTRLAQGDLGTILGLEGLPSPDVAQLAASAGYTVSRPALAQLWAHTQGHPLHVLALLQELPRDVLEAPGVALPAPRSLAALVLARLARCSPATQAVVRATAVLGERAGVGVVEELAEVADVLAALDEAYAVDLLQTVPGIPPRIAFSHPLIRSAVYHDLSQSERSALHARAAQLIGTPAALDHRVAAARREDAGLAADLEADGRRLGEAGRTLSAARRYVTAARLSPEPRHHDRLLLTAATDLLEAGEVGEVLAMASALWRCSPSPGRSYVLGHLALLQGRADDAYDLLASAAREGHDDPDAVARASGQLARLESMRGRPDAGITWAQRALATTNAPALVSAAVGVLAGNLAATGRTTAALAMLHDHGGDDGLEALLARGMIRLWTDDVEVACGDLSRVVTMSRDRPTWGPALLALGHLADGEFRCGRWDDSVLHGDLLVSLAHDSEQEWLRGFAHAHASWVLAARGDWPRVEGHLAGAGPEQDWSRPCLAAARVHAAFCRQDLPMVLAAARPLREVQDRRTVDEPGVHPWREALIDALIGLDQPAEAATELDRYEQLANDRQRRSCLAAAARLRGTLAARLGDADAAQASFQAGAAHHDAITAPFEAALLAEANGRFLRRRGERRLAIAQLTAALDTYDRLGARPFADRLVPELAASGQRRVGRRTHHTGQLTPQELAVARLVALGHTNREVAASLIISIKTVEYHLANVFARLDIRSRRELRGRFPELGREPAGGL